MIIAHDTVQLDPIQDQHSILSTRSMPETHRPATGIEPVSSGLFRPGFTIKLYGDTIRNAGA